ncbi:hypothetical protein BHQ17_18305 [Mycolicibacterium holsaticum]|uniref:Serine hydrolase n=1 Tax=Mycolicibacterium holsaticum TaxID=152142 RepID=A0A1E3RGT7_9MYCO|nr:hypothetical protein BHQ17_18305 [Mycolicibacterium holsaticum]
MVVLLAFALLVGGIVVGRHLTFGSSIARGVTSIPKAAPAAPLNPPPTPTPPALPAHGDEVQLATEFVVLSAELGARVGLVVRGVGVGPTPINLGDWSVGPAWSTIKVPLAIAGLRASDPPVVTDVMRAAITQSDNAAAESIWASLGDPATAASKVQEVLAEVGDPTIVESRKVRPEFTAFGQTEWSLSNQAEFLAAAVCDPRNEPIRALMGHIEPDQKWGLGTIPGAQFKGGWGPSVEGDYLVRQLGVVSTQRGATAVAVAVAPTSGSFSDGTQALTKIAAWLSEHADLLPAGTCS